MSAISARRAGNLSGSLTEGARGGAIRHPRGPVSLIGLALAETQNETPLRETLLADAHRALGARMVPFAGYEMPVQYPTGIIAEHTWTRTHAGLFDVSHMGPSFLVLNERSGDADADHDAVAGIVETVVSGDIRGLKPGQIRYTLLLGEEGGILDDLMVARPADPAWSGILYIVVNAGTKDDDFAIIQDAAGDLAELRRSDDHGLLALQGPEAAAVMEGLVPAATGLSFMHYNRLPTVMRGSSSRAPATPARTASRSWFRRRRRCRSGTGYSPTSA